MGVCIPNKPKSTNIAMLYIDGGRSGNRQSVPTSGDPLIEILCGTTRTVAAHLSAIPDEPITFSNDPIHKSRTEDAIIAFTWRKWINETITMGPGKADDTWLLRFPMTKAAVRALDTIESFTASFGKGLTPVTRFVVGGASKRGWTTWTTGGVGQPPNAGSENRIAGIVPIVAPVGDVVPQINQMYQAYGGWSFALQDYLDEGCMDYLNLPVFEQLLDVVGVMPFKDNLTMTIFPIVDTGDEFFMPDGLAIGNWFDKLPGPKIQRTVFNAEHSLTGHQIDVTLSVQSMFTALIEGKVLPTLTSTVSPDGTTITVQIGPQNAKDAIPKKCIMAHAYNSKARDFRLIKCGDVKNPACLNPIIWTAEDLVPQTNNTWSVTVQPPEIGWKGFLIECEFDFAGLSWLDPLKLTSPVSIIPQNFPFPPCPP